MFDEGLIQHWMNKWKRKDPDESSGLALENGAAVVLFVAYYSVAACAIKVGRLRKAI